MIVFLILFLTTVNNNSSNCTFSGSLPIHTNIASSDITLNDINKLKLTDDETEFMETLFLMSGDLPPEKCKKNVTNHSTGVEEVLDIDIISDGESTCSDDSDTYSVFSDDSLNENIKNYNPFRDENNISDNKSENNEHCLKVTTDLTSKISDDYNKNRIKDSPLNKIS